MTSFIRMRWKRNEFIAFVVALTVLLIGADQAIAADPIRVMSFNIRYGTANDGINRWENRREFLIETVKRFHPDLLGTQETLAFQRDYLLEQLSGFETVAAGRDDGKEAGEMAALFYRKERFEAIESGHFWLSEMPDQIGSKGWDAALPRIASWVKLRDRQSPDAKPILFLNTHFDHKGKRAREESASLIVSKLQQIGSDCRWIVTGDFNADPKDRPYANLFHSRETSSQTLIDTLRAVQPTPQPDEGTFSGFNASQTGGPRIDWIGCSDHFIVQSAEIVRDAVDGRTPSDHFPVTSMMLPQ
jgi:endonuclease/exonuclease/phosphatase family metal-dependent hydrolase